MSIWLDQLSVLVAAKNVHGLVSKLVEIVPEYWPSPEIISLGAMDRHDQVLNYRLAHASLFWKRIRGICRLTFSLNRIGNNIPQVLETINDR